MASSSVCALTHAAILQMPMMAPDDSFIVAQVVLKLLLRPTNRDAENLELDHSGLIKKTQAPARLKISGKYLQAAGARARRCYHFGHFEARSQGTFTSAFVSSGSENVLLPNSMQYMNLWLLLFLGKTINVFGLNQQLDEQGWGKACQACQKLPSFLAFAYRKPRTR